MSTNHTQRSHALLSASGSKRWMNCTASPQLESKYKEQRSVYADEGTLAHELSEIELKRRLKLIDSQKYEDEVYIIRTNELYTLEMPRQVEKYVNLVLERYTELQRLHGADFVYISIEERLDFSHFVPHGFGTGDIVIVWPGGLDVMDLKYGKGVPVYADNNSQLMLYGLGAHRAYELYTDIEIVHLHVIQPRLDNASTWSISEEDLIKWATEEVQPKAKEAYDGNGSEKAGDWCRWCRAKATCRTLADRHLELAKLEFADPKHLTDEEILDVYGKLDLFNMWVKAVQEHVFKTALDGKKWDGYKLVAGRANRKWADNDKVIKALKKQKFKKAQYINEKLKGIGDISNLMSVDEFQKVLGDLVIKPEGKPTLVPISDKRAEFGLQQALYDFAD